MSATDGAARLALLVVDGAPAAESSLARHNREGLPVHRLSANDPRLAQALSVLPVSTGPGERQQAAVLAFATLGLADVYVHLPVGTRFVRDFGSEDFLDGSGRAYAFLTEDRERRVAGSAGTHDIGRARSALGVATERVLTAAGPLAYTSGAVIDLLRSRGGSPAEGLASLIVEVPDASAWYAAWLSLGELPTLREPVFLMLGADGLPVDYSLRAATPADIARGYVGVVGARDRGAGDRTTQVLARDVPPGELVRAALLRAYRKAPRLQRLLGRLPGSRRGV